MLRSSRVVAGLPPEVEDVFEQFRTCELSTLARDEINAAKRAISDQR